MDMTHQYVALTVGKPWPFATLEQDAARSAPDGPSLTWIVELSELTDEEIQAFRTGPLSYGINVQGDVPFLLLSIPGLGTFDCYLNMHLEPQRKRDAFFDDPGASLMQCYLVDRYTGILRGIRAIGTHPDFLRSVKAACSQHLTTYKDSQDVVAAANIVLARYTTDDLMQAGTMYAAS